MKFYLEPRPPAPVTQQSLAAELAERCYPPLRHKPWPARLAALAEMHDQLRDDMADAAAFRATFPLFVALLVGHFGAAAIDRLAPNRLASNRR